MIMKKIILRLRGSIKEPATRAHIHKGPFSRRFSIRFTRACAAIFASALWRRLLFSLSLALTCTLLWSCALPIHSSASFLSFLALFICALLGRCSSTFSVNPANGFSNFPRAFDAFVVNQGSGVARRNQIYSNNESGGFTNPLPSTTAPENVSRGVVLGDLDGDGDLDAFVVNYKTANQIYTNNGSGRFDNRLPSTTAPANYSHGVALGDLDGDGDLDAFVTNGGSTGKANQIYTNDGSGRFDNRRPSATAPDERSYGVALGDLDGDGDLDAFVTNGIAIGEQNQIYTNNGSGRFDNRPPSTTAPANISGGVVLGDLDGDGDLDAFVVNGFGRSEQNQIYINDGSGGFDNRLPSATAPANKSFEIALGDLDGDGDLDAFVVNRDQANQIYTNNGSGRFDNRLPSATAPANNSRGVALGDLDGDGDLDAFVVNYGQANQIYVNNGSGRFDNRLPFTAAPANQSRGVALGELD